MIISLYKEQPVKNYAHVYPIIPFTWFSNFIVGLPTTHMKQQIFILNMT